MLYASASAAVHRVGQETEGVNRSQIGHQLHESSAKCDSPIQITKATASVLTVPAAASHAIRLAFAEDTVSSSRSAAVQLSGGWNAIASVLRSRIT